MNYDDIKAAMIDFVQRVTSCDAFGEYDARPYSSGPYFVLDILDEKVHGRDEKHRDYDEASDMIARHTEGQRGFTVSMSCFSVEEGNSSAKYVSCLIDELGKQSAQEFFQKRNIAIVAIGKPTTIPLRDDDRIIRITNIDVDFGTAISAKDTPIDFFETFLFEPVT